MITQMQHLHDLLVYTDYSMAQFLRMHNLANMFFTERWLLLELIREFSFEEALLVSEVQWACIALVAASWPEVGSTAQYSKLYFEQAFIAFAEEGSSYAQCDVNLIDSLIGEDFKYISRENGLASSTERSNANPPTGGRGSSSHHHEGDPVHMKDWVVELPSPDALGGGNNPFLLFLCVSLILEYKGEIIQQVHDVCDLFHLFQTRNRRHNLSNILCRARSLFDIDLKDKAEKRRAMLRQA